MEGVSHVGEPGASGRIGELFRPDVGPRTLRRESYFLFSFSYNNSGTTMNKLMR